jgi:hypothetical protein
MIFGTFGTGAGGIVIGAMFVDIDFEIVTGRFVELLFSFFLITHRKLQGEKI